MLKKPLFFLCLIMTAGILCGNCETELSLKITAAAFLLLCALLEIRDMESSGVPQEAGIFQNGKLRGLLLRASLILLFFLLGFFRAYAVSNHYGGLECASFFQSFESSNEGEFDYASYLKALGVENERERKQLKGELPLDEEPPLTEFLGYCRTGLNRICDRFFFPEDVGVMKTMLLGDSSDLEEATKELYRSAGISHLLSISGLHVSLVGMGLYGLLLSAGLGRTGAGVISGTAVILYVLLTGSSNSAIRAGVMLLIRFLALRLGRSYDPGTALGTAAAMLAFAHPYVIFTCGFQLSFAAAASMCLISVSLIRKRERSRERREPDRRGRFIRAANRMGKAEVLLISSVTVQLMTLPILLYHYYEIPAYALLINLLLIPMMTVVMYAGFAVLGTGLLAELFSGGLPGSFFSSIALLAACPGHCVLRFYELFCGFFERLPGSTVRCGRPAVPVIVLWYFLVYLLSRERKSKTLRQKQSERAAFSGTVAALLCAGAFFFARPEYAGLTVRCLDVGQGACSLVSYEGKHYLLDCGSMDGESVASYTVGPVLESLGIETIDKAFVSHIDTDHVSGLIALIRDETVEIRSLFLPAASENDERYRELTALYRAHFPDGSVEVIRTGTEYGEGEEMSLCCLYEGVSGSETNRHSPVLRLKKDAFFMIFPGDTSAEDEKLLAERSGEEWENGVSVLVAAHHGSASSNSEWALRYYRPKMIYYSYGKNRYGHPSAEVVGRFGEAGAEGLFSKTDGEVIIRTDGRKLSVRRFRKETGS